MPRKSPKPKAKRRSKGKKNHAYEVAKPDVKLAPGSLIGLWKLRGGTALSFLLLAILVWLMSQFFTTDRFYVYDVEVQGNQFVDRDEIYDASGLHELSIFWVKAREVETAIAALPGIKEARVTCRLPNRVRIEVVERRTQVTWQRGEVRYGVDDQGITMLPAEGESEETFLIQDLRAGPFEAGDRIDPWIIRSALELQLLSPETVFLQYSDDKGLIFYPADYPVYLGIGDVTEKVAVLNAFLQELAADGIQPEYVDVRFIESLSYKY